MGLDHDRLSPRGGCRPGAPSPRSRRPPACRIRRDRRRRPRPPALRECPESARWPPGIVSAVSTGASSTSGPARMLATTNEAGSTRGAGRRVRRDDAHAVRHAVDPGVVRRRLPCLGVDVERRHPAGTECRGRNRQDARAAAVVDDVDPHRRHRRQPLETQARGGMASGAEGESGLEPHHGAIRRRDLPVRSDPQRADLDRDDVLRGTRRPSPGRRSPAPPRTPPPRRP